MKMVRLRRYGILYEMRYAAGLRRKNAYGGWGGKTVCRARARTGVALKRESKIKRGRLLVLFISNIRIEKFRAFNSISHFKASFLISRSNASRLILQPNSASKM